MWIDRQVYDYMIKFNDEWYKGYNNYGTPKFMELLGFIKDETAVPTDADIYDSKRYKNLYRKGDVVAYTDDNSVMINGHYVYHLGHGGETSLEHYIDIPEELEHLKDMGQADAWRYSTEKLFRKNYGYVMGSSYAFTFEDMMGVYKAMDIEDEKIDNIFKENIGKELYKKYYFDLETFGDKIVELTNLRSNLHPMSSEFEPHTLYLTPQCGEYQRHQEMLEAFVKINKSYIGEDED